MKTIVLPRAALSASVVALMLLGASFALAQEEVPAEETIETNISLVEETTEIQLVTEEEIVIENSVPESDPLTEESVVESPSAEPEPAEETRAVLNEPELTTDKADYAPTDEATIFGKYFSPVYTFLLKIVGGFEDGSENVTFTDTLTTDDSGSFIYKYLLDGIYRPFYTAKALVIDAGNVIASVDFTDSKPNAVSLTPTSRTVIQSNTANYTVDVDMNGNSTNCSVTLELTTSLPAGASASFTGGTNPFSANSDYSRTLEIATNNSVTPGTYSFTVRATKAPSGCEGGNSPTVNGTLIVSSAAPVTASISGTKFKDLDADGAGRETGEPLLSGWTMRLYDTVTNPWTLIDTKVTDGSGAYSFTGVPIGSYKVCEVLQSGWIQTFASVQGSNSSPNASQEGQWCVTRNVTSSTNPDAANFGNFEKVNLTITASSHTIVYGAAVPTITPSYSGLITGDLAPDTLPTCASGAPPSPSAGGYTTSCSGAADPKYNITYVPGTLTINKAEPVCTINGYTGAYDGDAHGASGSCKGINNETLSGLNLGVSFTNVPGGSADWTFTDTTGNYIDKSGSVNILISKVDPTCTVTGYTVTYDGLAHTATGGCVGVKEESLSGLDLSGTTHTNANTYIDGWTYTDTTGNYNDDSDSLTDTINQADAACTINGYSGVYDGNAHGAEGSCLGVQGETLAGLNLGGTFIDVPGGTANWTFTDTTDNYNNTSGTAAVNITAAAANCVITGYTGIYDGAAHGASGTCIGIDETTLSGLDLGASFTNVPGGTANWTFTSPTLNYGNQNGTAAIVITKANASCTVTGYDDTYDSTEHTAEGSCLGVNDEVLAGLDLSGTTHTDAGEYTDTWNFNDVTNNYNNTSGSVTDKINKAALTLTAQPAGKQYSDPIPTLTGIYTGFVTGETTAVLTGTLDCTTTATQFSSAGAYPINCSGQTATNYTITPVAGTLTVTQENTAISYTGEMFALTAGPSITSAVVPLSAQLTQEVDAGVGDNTLANVTFTLVPQGSGSPIIVPNITVDSTGKALTSKTVSVGTYDITVSITTGNQYWVSAPIGAGTLTIAPGTTEQRVTGGGWIFDATSLNDKDNYGFTVNYTKSGAPKGNFLFMFRGEDGYDYKIKNNSWSQGGLSFLSLTKAYFSGKATLSKIDQQTGLVVFSDGSYTFGVTITDGGTGKTAAPDTFAITVFNSSGGVWKQLGPLAAGGGNIVIHNK